MSKSLTLEQKAIVLHESGHALVKAVPGSGKTTTLVKRVERLVKTGVDPNAILILMYNKSAQSSFVDKLKTTLKSSRIPEVRTFHSLALDLVTSHERQHHLDSKALLGSSDHRYDELVKQAYREGFSHEADYISPSDIEELQLFIDRCRAEAITPGDAAMDPVLKDTGPNYIRAYSRYCELLEESGLRTFDDCLIEANSLLQSNPDLRACHAHIIVDEYQDVNLIQHTMVRLLTKSHTSVMGVGDLNQAIYSWRGARPDFIGGLFEKHFRNTRVFHLSCTFRFGHEVSLIANSVIRRNSTKLDHLCISHPSTPRSEVSVHSDSCLSKVLADLPIGRGSQAILSRTNAHLAEAEIALRLCNLPYRYLKGNSRLHTRAEIGLLVVGFLLCVQGDLKSLEWHPHKQSFLFNFLRHSGFSWKTGQQKAAIKALMAPRADLLTVLGEIFSGSTSQINRSDRLAALRRQDSEHTRAIDVLRRLQSSGFIENLGATGVKRGQANDQKRGLVRIEELLESSNIDADTFLNLILHPSPATREQEPFVLSTIHTAKGLEWDSVVLIGLHDEEFPAGQPDGNSAPHPAEHSGSDDGLEEERRLFYVGITRSKRQLHLVVPVDPGLNLWLTKGWDTTPKRTPVATRFLYEAGLTACGLTALAIYRDKLREQKHTFNKLHQWYLDSLKKLKM